MTQVIDPAKLKAAAEHLEWVLQQYPDSDEVRALLQGLLPIIEEAKSGSIDRPLDRIPFAHSFADGIYVSYISPSVGGAYANFATEMAGGLSDAGVEIEAYIKAKKAALQQGSTS